MAQLTVSAPANGMFFVAGERPELVIHLTDHCGRVWQPARLGTANLYVAGPRDAHETRTASKLLNCITDRTAADRQHHTIYLASPHLADPSQNNLSTDADGTIHFRLSAITDEMAGTYTAGVWAKSTDELDQVFELVDFQIGTADVDDYISGPQASSTCYACHKGPLSGKSYEAHIFPGFSPFGNYALDALPIADCKLCHNADGYSLNPLVRKVHAVHRGEHLLNPGAAHPDYGLGADPTAAEFTDVAFPSMPNGEKDCVACHATDSWKAEPRRLSCGTCHDSVFFDTGTLQPPRVLGQPTGGPCTQDAQCSGLGALASCNTTTGLCQRAQHPIQSDDDQCATCHPADGTPTVTTMPVAAAHEIYQRTRTRGLRLLEVALSGGSGPSGTFRVGDVPTLTFKLTDAAGTVITDLRTNAALSPNLLVGGPTDDRQRVIGNPVPMKTQGTLSFDASSGHYNYTFPGPIPAGALQPFNSTAPARASNRDGTYTAWLYVNETISVGATQVRDDANALIDFKLGADQPLQPRQVIAQVACDSCHVRVQAHGGTRQAAEGCSICHTQGALDRAVGARGLSCMASAQCPGAAAGWEACQDTNGDGIADTCVITVDPTPGASIDFSQMIHAIHLARVRDGFAERANLVDPGHLSFVGFRNTLLSFAEVLFPMDIRNCSKCHVDVGGTCSASAPCGIGQECVGGTCRNRAWHAPSTRVCLSCHDADDSFGHAALMTYTDPVSGSVIETCEVCHGRGADFSVAKVHDIASPYRPPYPRKKE